MAGSESLDDGATTTAPVSVSNGGGSMAAEYQIVFVEESKATCMHGTEQAKTHQDQDDEVAYVSVLSGSKEWLADVPRKGTVAQQLEEERSEDTAAARMEVYDEKADAQVSALYEFVASSQL